MNKNKVIAKIFICIGFVLVFVLLCFGIKIFKPKHEIETNEISKLLKVDIKNSKKSVFKNDFDNYNFSGNGKYSCSFKYKKDVNMADKSGWKCLPISENIDKKIKAYELFKDSNHNNVLPNIKNGYYYYNNKTDDPYDESYNWSGDYLNCYLSIYDADTGMIYFVDANYL